MSTWQMDSEPGPEVTTVVDSRGEQWRRVEGCPFLWWPIHGGDHAVYRQWRELLPYGPLADVSYYDNE